MPVHRRVSLLLPWMVAAALVFASAGSSRVAAPSTSAPFTISRVKAVFNQQKFETVYTVDATTPPFEKVRPKLTANWTLKITCIDRGCGTTQGTDANPAPNEDPGCDNAGVGFSKPFVQELAPAEGAPFIWHHPSPGIIPPYHCDHSKQGPSGHQGLITVTVTGADWTCTAELGGTESYDGATDSIQAGEVRKGTAPECNKTQAGVTASKTVTPASAPNFTFTFVSTACQDSSSCAWDMANWGGGWVFSPDYLPTGEEIFSGVCGTGCSQREEISGATDTSGTQNRTAVVLASAQGTIAPGKTATVSLRLSKRGQALLKQDKTLTTTILGLVTNKSGHSKLFTKIIKLKSQP